MKIIVVGGGKVGTAPVSYTHLDVYKRQIPNRMRDRIDFGF